MLIKNNNPYKIMYDMEFIEANGTKDIKDKSHIKLLLNHPNVEKYIDLKTAEKLEYENKELKAQLEQSKLKKEKEEEEN